MPKVTIWIREYDYPAWEAIDDKPEWLSNALKVEKLGTKLMSQDKTHGNVIKDPDPYRPTHYKPTDDWGA